MTVLGGRKVNVKGRATGALRSNRRTKIAGQFAARTIEMLKSPSFRVLSLSARRVLDRLEIELAHHGGQDNGRLPVTYEQFHDYGLHRHAIGPGICECAALGFIEITERGRAGNAEFRSPNLFRLRYKPTRVEGPTDEWRKIDTLADAEALAEAARVAKRPIDGNRHRKRRQKDVDKKQNPSAGKRHVSVTETGTENAPRPVPETITTVPVPETITTSISRARGAPTPHTQNREWLYVATRPAKGGHA